MTSDDPLFICRVEFTGFENFLKGRMGSLKEFEGEFFEDHFVIPSRYLEFKPEIVIRYEDVLDFDIETATTTNRVGLDIGGLNYQYMKIKFRDTSSGKNHEIKVFNENGDERINNCDFMTWFSSRLRLS